MDDNLTKTIIILLVIIVISLIGYFLIFVTELGLEILSSESVITEPIQTFFIGNF